jgi:hypothetical protein
LNPTIYQHFKGGRYQLVGLAKDTTNVAGDRLFAVYRRIDSPHCSEQTLFCRAINEFAEEVEWPDGVRRPRFCPISLLTVKKE